MWNGKVVSIQVAHSRSELPHQVSEAEAVPGRGIAGDRYFNGQGTFSKPGEPDRELTLLASESLQDFAAQSGVRLQPADMRRQIVTAGVPLNDLVGRDFDIGDVRIRGIRLCEPCEHLANLTTPKVMSGLLHRAGIRAQVLTTGMIRVGDPVRQVVRIGVMGDFDPRKRSHIALNAALQHAAQDLNCIVETLWIPTESLLFAENVAALENFNGVIASPGSPYRSMQGMLNGIGWARRRDWVFFGSCGGFQHTLLEYARNAMDMPNADTAEDHTEHGARMEDWIISPISCPAANEPGSGPKLHGMNEVSVVPGSLLSRIYGGAATVQEEYFCNYETNPIYQERFTEAGLRTGAVGAGGEFRGIELTGNRFFLATLFQPHLSSAPDRPHPIIRAFVKAAAAAPAIPKPVISRSADTLAASRS
jgi:MOSC domain-containing protein YiiM